MTKKEYKRLVCFLTDANSVGVVNWHGWFFLHKPFAIKNNINDFQRITNLSINKSNLFAFPYKHIKSINLWISIGDKIGPRYF